MAHTLEGKVALILGGTRGIGGAISRRLAADGASVAMLYRSRSGEAEALAGEIGAEAIPADVADPAALLAAIDGVIARHGRIDILVNNAGTAIVGPLEDYPPDAFDRVFAVNVR
ncbi:MAG: SDR family NAD(P)-dependent oxidoreductase, partial [Alphaproteobacteria bacterium]